MNLPLPPRCLCLSCQESFLEAVASSLCEAAKNRDKEKIRTCVRCGHEAKITSAGVCASCKEELGW